MFNFKKHNSNIVHDATLNHVKVASSDDVFCSG